MIICEKQMQTLPLKLKVHNFMLYFFRGQTPADAEFNFLDHAKRLDMYGVDLHRARDTTNKDIHLGVTSVGLVVFQNNVRINTFSWSKIVKISFKRKQFFIQLRREPSESYDTLLGFNMVTYRSSKNLWKSCVEHHTFFRLHSPQIRSRRFPLTLGSKFHYSGRTEFQTVEEGRQRARLERHFISEGGFLDRGEELPPPFSPVLPVRAPPYADEEVESERPTSPPLYEASSYTEAQAAEEGLVVIRITPDDQGRFGFNVKGGSDLNMPILVSRVAPNTPADRCYPKLNEGDQVLFINNHDVAGMMHEQVVNLIRASRDSPTGELMLMVKPSAVYEAHEEEEEPPYQYVPDLPHVSAITDQADALAESMLLQADGLASGALVAQFEQLYRKKPGLSTDDAKKSENQSKNRYRDISPYDLTRVILVSGTSGDYINANYVNMEIPGSGIINRYIATQGPLPNTVADFWQMVVEAQSTLVVMVTPLVERGRTKCHQYWPALLQTLELGHLHVTCTKEEVEPSGSFVFREFRLTNLETEEERHISHMQYLAWPDHGVPDDSAQFLEFTERVRKAREGMVEPTIVHCSAGIGRTGVLILMETAMCLIEANEPVYPLDIVRAMRDQRAMMIQTASQYRFVCESVHRAYTEGIVKPLPEFQR
ncbi:Tyrosine-protein phosphatase non-receptor type 4 [Blattella germanica]|nr:Tyrosine-protein phosphatase non-receptor type 4 [Blattella germanica]